MKANLKLPRPGTVIATIGVTVACAGTATAASMITGAQIKDSTVTSRDIKNGSLKTSDMNRQLRQALTRQSAASVNPIKGDKGDAGIPGAPGVNGAQGERGATGAQGERGATGPAGTSTPQNVTSAPGQIATFSHDDVIPITGDSETNATSVADVQFTEPGLWNIPARVGVQLFPGAGGQDDLIRCEMSTDGNAATGGAEQQTGFSLGSVIENPLAARSFDLRSVFVMLTPQVVHFDCYDAINAGAGDRPAEVTGAGFVAEKVGKTQGLVEASN